MNLVVLNSIGLDLLERKDLLRLKTMYVLLVMFLASNTQMQSSISYENLSASHRCFLASIDADIEPTYYEEAVKNNKWINAMKAKLQPLEDNKTWKIVKIS